MMNNMNENMDKNIDKNIASLNIILPAPKPALAHYLPFKFSGTQLFVSGQGPIDANGDAIIGCLGTTLDIKLGQKAAQLAAINILAQLKQALKGDWDRLIGCLKLNGFVNATANFTQHPQVINGASDLIHSVLEDKAMHTRCAIGVSSLPLGWAVEIDALFEVHRD